MKKVEIKYFSNAISPIISNPKGDWIDLRSAETVTLKKGDFALIPLGIGMKLPKGYEAHVAPRSSTFKHWGILQTNSVAVIDNSYCGDDDEWKYPVYATRDVTIHRNDRICQFRIVKNQPKFRFKLMIHLGKASRGGFGSTGSN